MGGHCCSTFELTAEVVTEVEKGSADRREDKVVQYCHVIRMVIMSL